MVAFEDRIASCVDGPYREASRVVVVKVDWMVEESRWEGVEVQRVGGYVLGWWALERCPAVGANTSLPVGISPSGLPPLRRGELIIVGG